jgi:large subunit ribosomal protein L6
MSRVAKKIISIPSQVKIEVQDRLITLTGPRGQLQQSIPEQVDVKLTDDTIQVLFLNEKKEVRSKAGTLSAHLSNHIKGVSEGWTCMLVLVKVGARAQIDGDVLILNIGYSNPKRYVFGQEVAIRLPSPTEIVIEGNDIQKVNQIAADIIRIRPPEPYKGTGILRKGEKIKLKAAKKK